MRGFDMQEAVRGEYCDICKMVRRKHKSEPVESQTEFHVLFNAEGGPVQECLIDASCLLECESRLKELHPEAVYWEIGI